jgi:two-component system chemotaxis response regulator CheY
MASSPYSNLSVIIVDDVLAMRAILRALLRNLGIQNVVEASDGVEALEILRPLHKSLIITDLCMTPMDGIELTRQLRKPKSLNAFVPILMISGHNEKARIREAAEAGVTAFLLKPVIPKAFVEKVKSLVELPLPMVRSGAYYGPDRRRRTVWVRNDRRSTDTSLLE